MPRFTYSELDSTTFRSLVEVNNRGVNSGRWEALRRPLTDRDRQRLKGMNETLVDQPLGLLNEATIWARAIYPMLVLAERGSVLAFSQIPLEARFSRFELTGTLDGALATSASGSVEAPYLVVVEAKRGLEAVNPQWQLFGEMLAAMARNTQHRGATEASVYGCYTISDTWTFVHAEGSGLDSDRPQLVIESSGEYAEHSESEAILSVLKGIVEAQFTLDPRASGLRPPPLREL